MRICVCEGKWCVCVCMRVSGVCVCAHEGTWCVCVCMMVHGVHACV